MTFNSTSEPAKSNKNEIVSQTSINETKDNNISNNDTNIWYHILIAKSLVNKIFIIILSFFFKGHISYKKYKIRPKKHHQLNH
jgi:hypothetical protein